MRGLIKGVGRLPDLFTWSPAPPKCCLAEPPLPTSISLWVNSILCVGFVVPLDANLCVEHFTWNMLCHCHGLRVTMRLAPFHRCGNKVWVIDLTPQQEICLYHCFPRALAFMCPPTPTPTPTPTPVPLSGPEEEDAQVAHMAGRPPPGSWLFSLLLLHEHSCQSGTWPFLRKPRTEAKC